MRRARRGSTGWWLSWRSTRRTWSSSGSLTLRGERGAQALETEAFVEALRARLDVPVHTEDERFTTALAQQTGGRAPEDAIAAAHLLQGWLGRTR